MVLFRRNLYISFLGITFLLSLVTDWYYPLTILFLCFTIVTLLDKLGKGIVLRELIVLHAVVICLLMPIIGYEVYNRDNHLARMFLKFMLVPKERYFGFVLPAVSAFALALCWPIRKNGNILDEGAFFEKVVQEIKKPLSSNTHMGVILIGIGVAMSYTIVFLPIEFKFIGLLFYAVCFTGILYTYYSPTFRYKKLVFLSFALFIFWTAAQTGVFTIVAYMGVTLFSF